MVLGSFICFFIPIFLPHVFIFIVLLPLVFSYHILNPLGIAVMDRIKLCFLLMILLINRCRYWVFCGHLTSEKKRLFVIALQLDTCQRLIIHLKVVFRNSKVQKNYRKTLFAKSIRQSSSGPAEHKGQWGFFLIYLWQTWILFQSGCVDYAHHMCLSPLFLKIFRRACKAACSGPLEHRGAVGIFLTYFCQIM